MTKQQMTNLIGAGTVATIMLILGLVFGGSPAADATGATAVDSVPAIVEVAPSVPTDGLLQNENQQLRDTIQVLQEREAQFVEQITIANEQLAAPAYGEGEEGEEYEGEEYEHEEEEHEEYDEEEEDDD